MIRQWSTNRTGSDGVITGGGNSNVSGADNTLDPTGLRGFPACSAARV
jgi:hypothetical protein